MSKTTGSDHKVLVSGSIDPDVFEMLQAHSRAHPKLSRSGRDEPGPAPVPVP